MYIYTPSNQHFKAFLVSKFNSETSFLYQLFKENSDFIVKKPCKVIYLSAFYDIGSLYLFIYIYTPSNQHFKGFPVSKIIRPLQVEQAETSVALQELRTGWPQQLSWGFMCTLHSAQPLQAGGMWNLLLTSQPPLGFLSCARFGIRHFHLDWLDWSTRRGSRSMAQDVGH